MSQRSYNNDRNRKGAVVGSTRKSAASAKPVRKQGTVEVTKASSTKSKPAGPEKDWTGLPTSPEIKKWRRIWWVLLLGGIAAIAVGYLLPELRANENAQRIIAIVVLLASMTAVTIDLVVIRRLRKQLIESAAKKPSKKAQKHAGDEQAAKTSGKDEA
ncbi:MAG: hypothetical protein JW733_04150 [Coriobacteriia bacterium]|nr:hypothetical protein [Coriobacteriia bacterium]